MDEPYAFRILILKLAGYIAIVLSIVCFGVAVYSVIARTLWGLLIGLVQGTLMAGLYVVFGYVRFAYEHAAANPAKVSTRVDE